VPLPVGAETESGWYDDDAPHQAFRIIYGRVRSIGDEIVHLNGHTTGLCDVETSACQYPDGTLDTGNDGPRVQVHVYDDSGLTAAQARGVAALLLEAADEVDGWVQR
jgi:hypothetical protein